MNSNSEALHIRKRQRKPAISELGSLIEDAPNFEEWDIYLALDGNRKQPRAIPFDMTWETADLVEKGYTHFIRFPRVPEVIRDPHQRKFVQILSATKDAMRRPGVHMAEVEEAGAKIWEEAERYWHDFYSKKAVVFNNTRS